MNRDTLYSSGVFDLDAAPLTISLPDAEKRVMSMQASHRSVLSDTPDYPSWVSDHEVAHVPRTSKP
jgi:hypothetical protein